MLTKLWKLIAATMFGGVLILVLSIYLGPSSVSLASDHEIAKSADQVHPLLIGQTVPSTSVFSVENKKTDLLELVAAKKTILVFYRGGWCPYCNLQLKGLKDVEQDLLMLGFQIVAVSPDQVAELKKSITKHQLQYKLYSDSLNNASKAFGVAFKVDDKIISQYKGFGIDLDKASGNSNHILPVPAVFVLNEKGEIQFEYINPNYKVRLSGNVLLAAAKAATSEGQKKPQAK